MKEEVTEEDVTVMVRGFFYKIPYYVLADDSLLLALATTFLHDMRDPGREEIINRVMEWCNSKNDITRRHTLIMIRSVIAIHPEEYYSYRYVKFSDHDDVKEACKAYVGQFEDDDTLTRLKRELAFYAGDQFRTIKTEKDATRQLH